MRVAFIEAGAVTNLADFPDDADLASFAVEDGVVLVPVGEAHAAIDFAWSESGGFAAPEIPLEQRRDRLAGAINAQRDEILAGGYQHNFGGSAGIRRLDNRSEGDAINWLGLKGMADALIADGEGETLMTLRDAGNRNFSASAETISSALVAMAAWRSAVLAHSWALKDDIEAAADAAALDEIDIEAGWPD